MADLNSSLECDINLDGDENLHGNVSSKPILNRPTLNITGVSPSATFSAGVQGLMLQQEEAFKAELDQLASQLAEIEEACETCEGRISELESEQYDQSHVENIEKENDVLIKQISETNFKARELYHVINEYERSISMFKNQYEVEKQKLLEQDKMLSLETDLTNKYVNTMEANFNNIHQKYEKCKHVLEELKDYERKLAKLAHESTEKLRVINYMFQSLKEQTTEKLEKCHAEMTNIVKSNRTDYAKLQAVQQRLNLKLESQEQILLEKKDELAEIVKMCDRLIGTMNQ